MNQSVRCLVAVAFIASAAFAADAPPARAPGLPGEKPKRPGKPPAEHSHGREAALADTATMTVADGLAVTLFACEPMVVNPCDMDIDERGRVWITEGANYRLSMHTNWGTIRAGGDRIQILEDTDGDGVADKASTFYQDPSINAALGICVLGNKAIVSSSPNVFRLTDTGGYGAAGKR